MRRATVTIVAALAVLSLVAGAGLGAASAQQSVDSPDLLIDQPTHIDSEVTTEFEGEGQVYYVTGSEFQIWLQDVDHDNIESAGIADGSGVFEYDEQRDLFHFEPTDEGTMTLFWEESDGNATQRYEATVRIDQPEFVHQTAAEFDGVRENAEMWQDVETEVNRNFPDRDADEVISSALTKERIVERAFGPLRQQVMGLLLMAVTTPGGLLVSGIILAAFLATVYRYMRKANRLDKQTRDEHELEQERFEIQVDKSEQVLQQVDFNERFDDHTAARLRELLSENPWLASKKIMQMWSPKHVKGTVMQLMGQVGYEGVKRVENGEIIDAWTDKDAAQFISDDDDLERVDLTALNNGDGCDQQFIDRVSGDDLDLTIFDDPRRLDLSAVDLPIDNRDVDDADLIAELEPRFPEDFKDEEHMAEAMGRVFEIVATHPVHTDDEGKVDERMDLVSFNSEIATTLADEADFPAAHTYKRIFYAIAEGLDSEAKLEQQTTDLETHGLGGD